MAHRKPPLGVCKQCWKPLAPPARTCEPCRRKDRSRTQLRRERLNAAGRCPGCGGPKGTTIQMCDRCAESHRKAQETIRLERIKHKLCPKCGDKAQPGRVVCRLCAIAKNHGDRERREAFATAGKCKDCGKNKPMRNRVNCASCTAKRIARRSRVVLRKRRVMEFRQRLQHNPDRIINRLADLITGRPHQQSPSA